MGSTSWVQWALGVFALNVGWENHFNRTHFGLLYKFFLFFFILKLALKDFIYLFCQIQIRGCNTMKLHACVYNVLSTENYALGTVLLTLSLLDL